MPPQLITFGCRLNTYESEVMRSHADKAGLQDAIIINTCAVTAEAERQARQSIRRLKKENPQARIIVTGCAAQIRAQDFAAMPEVDTVLGNDEKMKEQEWLALSTQESGAGSQGFHSFSPRGEGKDEGEARSNSETSPSPPPNLPPQGGGETLGGKEVDPALSGANCAAEYPRAGAGSELSALSEANGLLRTQQREQGQTKETTLRVNDIMEVKEVAGHMVNAFTENTRAFIQVQNGCDHRCTFCIIPYGRGNSRSVPMPEIIAQVRHLVEQGVKEVVLTGVDISDYGNGLPGAPSLGNLVRRILKLVPDLPRLRISSIDAVEVDAEFWRALAEEERLMPHLHLSLQAGDDMVLKRMKRRHLRADIMEFVTRARDVRPDIVFGADIIAGFPTENEEMFVNTLDLVEEANLTWLHVFPYSARQGTPAAKMPQVKKEVRKERAERLRQAGERQVVRFLASEVGKTRQVLVEKNGIGHTEHFAPVKLENATPGALVTAYMSHAGKECLQAEAA